MIPSIIRFGNANYNLASKELNELERNPFGGVRRSANYKFNKNGRIASMSVYDWDDERNDLEYTCTIYFDRDIETDEITRIIHTSPYSETETIIDVNFNDLALGGRLNIFSNDTFNAYSVFNNENETLITDGYEEHRIIYDNHGRIARTIMDGISSSFTYNSLGQLIRTTVETDVNGDTPTTVYYYYDNNLPVKTITLNNDGMYVSYIPYSNIEG